MYEFTSDWFSSAIPTWDAHVRPLAASGPVQALELGCYEGRASVWLLENVLTDPASRLTVVDTFDGPPEVDPEILAGVFDRFRRNIEETGRGKQVRVLRTSTVEAMTRLLAADDEPRFDFIYVDANHGAPHVLTDAVFASQLLRPGGVLAFDDYLWQHGSGPLDRPKIAVDAFLAIFAGSYEVLHKGYQVLVRKPGSAGPDTTGTDRTDEADDADDADRSDEPDETGEPDETDEVVRQSDDSADVTPPEVTPPDDTPPSPTEPRAPRGGRRRR